MVDALAIIYAPLGVAFLLGMLRDDWRVPAYALTLATLAFVSWLAADWLWALAAGQVQTLQIFTAGAKPPFSINLQLGIAEAGTALLVALTGLLSSIFLKDTLLRLGRRAMAVLLIFIMAICGIIMTRDIFNLFVFLELVVIATAGLVLLSHNEHSLGAGFK
jgi:formate hydrogenlyase subunit 3/multisubunit Na+/H+ antiporter MnhD subunit